MVSKPGPPRLDTTRVLHDSELFADRGNRIRDRLRDDVRLPPARHARPAAALSVYALLFGEAASIRRAQENVNGQVANLTTGNGRARPGEFEVFAALGANQDS